MKTSHFLVAALCCLPLFSQAHNINVGQKVAAVSVEDRGELMFDGKDFSYQKWDTKQLAGKVRVIQHIAGRSAAKELNDPVITLIKAAHFPENKYQTTTIVNTNDAIWGTSAFVRSSLESSKKEFPWSQFIADTLGVTKTAWQLNENSSAIIVLDKQGKVRFIKDGELSEQDNQKVMTLLHTLLATN